MNHTTSDYLERLVDAHMKEFSVDLKKGFKWQIDTEDKENWHPGTIGVLVNPKDFRGEGSYPVSSNAEEFLVGQGLRDRFYELTPGSYEFVGTEQELRDMMSKEGDFFEEGTIS